MENTTTSPACLPGCDACETLHRNQRPVPCRHCREDQATHTPTPWHTVAESKYHKLCTTIRCGEDKGVADVYGTDEEAVANAAFIVRACNGHEELLAALNGLIDAADGGEVFDHDMSGCEDCALCTARAARDKATGR